MKASPVKQLTAGDTGDGFVYSPVRLAHAPPPGDDGPFDSGLLVNGTFDDATGITTNGWIIAGDAYSDMGMDPMIIQLTETVSAGSVLTISSAGGSTIAARLTIHVYNGATPFASVNVDGAFDTFTVDTAALAQQATALGFEDVVGDGIVLDNLRVTAA